jgi:alkanesulfonate monooxygenase SsuD/methylene tetrahydromethanopterin reductase-like flavin-dependent oxidoreductase (luciferase family)
VGVAESREEALRLYREPAEYFYNRCLHVDARFARPPGYASEATMRARVTSQVAQAAVRAGASNAFFSGVTMEQIVDQGYVIVGSPDEVAEQLRKVVHDLRVGHLMLLLQFGNMGRDRTLHNTELFAKRVLPQLRGIFDDEWEDRWWPRPLPPAERATPGEAAP